SHHRLSTRAGRAGTRPIPLGCSQASTLIRSLAGCENPRINSHSRQSPLLPDRLLGFAGVGMEVKTVGIVGAGTMGNGIAHVFAKKGYQVVLCDIDRGYLDRALETIGKNLDRELAKNKITADDRAATLNRIQPVTQPKRLA